MIVDGFLEAYDFAAELLDWALRIAVELGVDRQALTHGLVSRMRALIAERLGCSPADLMADDRFQDRAVQ